MGEMSRLYFFATLVAADCENMATIFSNKFGDPLLSLESEEEDDKDTADVDLFEKGCCCSPCESRGAAADAAAADDDTESCITPTDGDILDCLCCEDPTC